jgi:hypothetical protein
MEQHSTEEPYTNTHLVRKLNEHYDNSIIITHEHGKSSLVTLRSQTEHILAKFRKLQNQPKIDRIL